MCGLTWWTRLRRCPPYGLRSHAERGSDHQSNILKDVDFPWPIASIIKQHHERIDGSGYPLGLNADDILLESKILAVADIVEAMASHRPYRPALGIDIALGEIAKQSGVTLDAQVVDACIRVFHERGFKLAEQ